MSRLLVQMPKIDIRLLDGYFAEWPINLKIWLEIDVMVLWLTACKN